MQLPELSPSLGRSFQDRIALNAERVPSEYEVLGVHTEDSAYFSDRHLIRAPHPASLRSPRSDPQRFFNATTVL